MSPAPERKFKQALLPFNKKRKLENEVADDDSKCKKTCHDTVSEVNDNPSQQEPQKIIEDKYVTKEREKINDKSNESSRNDQNCENASHACDTDAEDEKMDVSISSSNNVEIKNSSELYLTEDLKSTVPILSDKNEDDNLDNTLSSNSADISMTEETKSAVPENSDANTTNKFVQKKYSEKNVTPKNFTPKQLQKRKEAELKRLERERQKQEKEQKKQEEKEQKEKKRLAELEIKHAEKKQKEEEKRAREEERRQKEEERKVKEEERRQKALAKEEERRQKEEEKRQKEEHEKKLKQKTAAIFTNFFLRSKTQSNVKIENDNQPESTVFMPFQVKDDMKLAPVNRASFTSQMRQVLDEVLEKQGMDKESLYLAVLKSGNYKPGHSEDTWALNRNDSDEIDVLCYDDSAKCKVRSQNRPKLLQFGENRRPAYWGTWRKRSKSINPRRPWAQDTVYFDYGFDSDDEWVEEEPGESLHGSDDEKESEDEYEVDNELFVPHGYLSDEEGGNDEDVAERSPKSQKLKLNLLEKEFEAEMKEKTRKLTPRVFGCKWIPNNIVDKDMISDDVDNLLLSFRAVYDDARLPFHPKAESENITPQNTPSVKGKLRLDFPDSLVPCLIKLVHGNKNSASKLAEEFSLYVLNQESSFKLSKTCIVAKIKEISSWVRNIACWIVTEEIRNQNNLGELTHQENSWKYVSNIEMNSLVKKQKLAEKQTINPSAPVVTTPSTSQKSDTSSIAKFLKVLTPEEKQKQLIVSTGEKKTEGRSSDSPILNYVGDKAQKEPTNTKVQLKKRAILFTLDKKNPKKLLSSNNILNAATNPEKISISNIIATVNDPCPVDSAEAQKVLMPNKVLTEEVIQHEENRSKPNIRHFPSENLKVSSVSSHKKEENVKVISANDSLSLQRSSVNVSSNLNSKSTDEKSVNSNILGNVDELNSSKSLPTNENISRIQQGKKYAKLFTIGKINKE